MSLKELIQAHFLRSVPQNERLVGLLCLFICVGGLFAPALVRE